MTWEVPSHRPCRRPCHRRLCHRPRRRRRHRRRHCRPRRHHHRRSPPRTSQRNPPHLRRPPTHPSPRAQSARWLGCMSTPRRRSPGNRPSHQTIPGERYRPATPRTRRRTPPTSTRNRRNPLRKGSARASACCQSGVTNSRPSCSCPWWNRKEENEQATVGRSVKKPVKQALYLLRKKATAHLLPWSLNSRKYSISNSNRLETSQAAGAVSRNTAPIGTQVNCMDDMITPAVTSSTYSGTVC
jgi:hypothetical protein